MKSVLPNKMSDLILVALKDLEKVEKMKSRVVDMYDWHKPLPNGKCAVCLAGAVMDRTFKLSPSVDNTPSGMQVSREDQMALKALNSLRSGYVIDAYLYFNPDFEYAVGPFSFNKFVVIPEYKGKGIRFKKAMRNLALDLRAKGY